MYKRIHGIQGIKKIKRITCVNLMVVMDSKVQMVRDFNILRGEYLHQILV